MTKQEETTLPVTLSIDIGGQGIKSMAIIGDSETRGERQRIKTPRPATPSAILEALEKVVESNGPFDRITIGFPGVVTSGVVRTAPNLDGDWLNVPLQEQLADYAKLPTRLVNDADMQGCAAISGVGVEMVLTLGTGMGSALFVNGQLVPNLEFGHHPFEKEQTYEERLGQEALDTAGVKSWNHRLERAIKLLRKIFNFRHLYIGGGNARCVEFELPSDVTIVKNSIAFIGGARLWNYV
jgi:polyphosphate glucokinase